MRISDWSSDVCSSDLRTHWEMATYGALTNALASGDIWVPRSRLHRSLDVLLAPLSGAALQPPFSLGNPHAWLDQRAAQLDSALRDVAHNLAGRDAALFAGERLRFPKELKDDDARHDEGRSEEHTSELQSLMRISYAVFCLKKKKL